MPTTRATPALDRAVAAVAAQPGASNRALAALTGVSHESIKRARARLGFAPSRATGHRKTDSPQDSDARKGDWSREKLVAMDSDFAAAMEAAIAAGKERPPDGEAERAA